MIIIKVTENIDRFINKCLKYNINLHNIKKNKDELYVKIDENDLDRIIKLNYYSQIEITKYLGLKGLSIFLKHYLLDFIYLLLFFILIYFISNFIISIEIKHENKNLIKEVDEILKSKKIKILTPSKSLGELNKISDEILYENRDFLDWISINKIGMKYIVSFEERIHTEEKEEAPHCHVVASKDGVIKSIKTTSGVNMFNTSEYVKKGDIIISGEIKLNEDIKDNICAQGEVIAETWYKVHIIVPINYEEKEYTNKKRYNLVFNGNYLKKKKYESYDEEKVLKIGPFKLIREKEYTIKKKNYTKEEAEKMGIDTANKRLLEKIGKNNTIIEQKVLNSEVNNSKIELEVFISVDENIGSTQYFEVGEKVDPE